MKHRKKLIVSVLLLIVILISFVFSVAFNYSMYQYIDDEARNNIQKDIEFYNEESEASYYFYDDATTFTSTILYTNSDYRIVEDQYMRNIDYEYDKCLVKECQLNKEKLENGEILVFYINNEKYYIAQISDVSYLGEHFDVGIVYINTAPMQRLIKKTNIIYAIIIFVSLIVVCLAGLYTGKMLDDSDRKMKQFFQNVSHELKTPIMAIQGYAEGIEQNVIPNHGEAAKIILTESDKMEVLVNEILELSKFESGLQKPVFSITDLSELLYEVLERLYPLAEKRNIGFDIKIQDNVIGSCDSELIERVFLNLLTNALRYAKETIMISCEKDKRNIIICVIDDGGALEKEDAKHIFERFYRGLNGSSGVGLSLVKEIVELHKGKIYVETDKYTNFIVKFPLKS